MIGFFITLLLSLNCCLGYLQEVSVYQTHPATNNIQHVDLKEGLMYFSDKFNWDLYSLNEFGDKKEEVVEFLDSQYELSGGQNHSQKPQLVVVVNEDVDGFNKSFVIDQKTGKFSEKFNHMVSKYGKTLTNEIHYIGQNDQVLSNHFQGFDHRSMNVWSNLINNDMQTVLSQDMKYVSDKLFISEISSLLHLNTFNFNHDDILVVNLNLLLSLGNKIGTTSTTYKSAKQLVSVLLQSFSQFDITIIKDSAPQDAEKLTKRSQELELVFNIREGKKDKSKNANCFDSEENCQVSTSNCNSHGVCSKASGCWSCVCSSSFNKTLSKTTNWSGFDCSKKDISSSANLLLWSSLAILILFGAGIKLLMSVGDEPLPGVLDATSKGN